MVRSNCSSPQNIFNAYFDQSSATAIVSLTEEYYIIKEAAQQARLFKERAQLGAFQHSSLRQNDKEDSYDIELWNTNQRISSFRTNEPTFQISMAGLPAGLYFVRVVKDGQTYTQKLIKK
ncbi:T9SS type A sorting domain-containing protein [Tannerella forsythia]